MASYGPGADTKAITDEIVACYRSWRDRWTGWASRRREIRALATGDWGSVFTRDVDETNLPMVTNFFRDTIEDGGRMFAEQLPIERRYAEGARGEANAEDVEQVINGLTQGSGIFNYPEFFGMDMIACGLTAIKIWPRYSRAKAEGGLFPRFRRIDPDFVLPDPNYQPDQPTERALICYTESVARLSREYPEQIEALLMRVNAAATPERIKAYGYDLEKLTQVAGPPAELTTLEWYSGEFIARVAYFESDLGYEAELLRLRPNDTGLCPVQLAHRPTWAREPLGQLDDSKGVVRTENRYMRLLIDYFVEMVYGGKLVWNVKNPTDRGPGTRYFALGPDAKMDPVGPEIPSFQAFQIMDRLDDHAREGMNNPRSRGGDVELNKATAAFLTKAQGKLASSTRGHQRSFAVAKRYANEAALAQDEAWCNERKVIVGLARGKRYRLTYTPKTLIRGDYSNFVSYGTASGLDAPTHSVLMLEKRQARTISLETYLENDPAIDDVPAELARLSADELRESILLGMKLETTPLADRLVAYQMFARERPLQDIVEALLQLQATRAAPGLGGAIPMGPGAPPGLPPGPGAGPAAAMGAPPGVAGAEGPPGPVLPPIELLRRVGPARAGRR